MIYNQVHDFAMIFIYRLLPIAFGFVLLQISAPVAADMDYTKIGLVGLLAMAVAALWRTNEKKDKVLLDLTASVTKSMAEQTAELRALKEAVMGNLTQTYKLHEENRDRLEDIRTHCTRCGDER